MKSEDVREVDGGSVGPRANPSAALSSARQADQLLPSLRALIGPEASDDALRALLSAARGDVSVAANRYFDSPEAARAPAGIGAKRPPQSFTPGSAAALDSAVRLFGVPASGPKVAGTITASGACGSGTKRRKRQTPSSSLGAQSSQRSITSFLSPPSPSVQVEPPPTAPPAAAHGSVESSPHYLLKPRASGHTDYMHIRPTRHPGCQPSPSTDSHAAVEADVLPLPSALPSPSSQHSRAALRQSSQQPPDASSTGLVLRTDASDLTLPLHKYRPLEPCWSIDTNTRASCSAQVPYRHLALTLEALEATRSRLDKERILTNAFRSMIAMGGSLAEIEAAAYLLAPAKDPQAGGHRLRPEWVDARPLGLSHASLSNAICEATGSTRAELSRINSSLRDSGAAAVALRDGSGGGTRQQVLSFVKRPPPLSLGLVHRRLLSLADICGDGTEKKKTNILVGLLRAAPPGAQGASELKWLVRTCVPHMSAGISLAGSVLPALAAAAVIEGRPTPQPKVDTNASASMVEADANESTRSRILIDLDEVDTPMVAQTMESSSTALGTPPGPSTTSAQRFPSVAEIKAAQEAARVGYALRPDVAALVNALVSSGGDVQAVRRECTLRIGIPCAPMLAKPATSALGALTRCAPPLVAEYKYDGQRAQVHCACSGAISIFSRKLDLMTDKYPEVVAAVRRAFRAPCARPSALAAGTDVERDAMGSFVLDTEIVPVKALSVSGTRAVTECDDSEASKGDAANGSTAAAYGPVGASDTARALGTGGTSLSTFQSLATRKRKDVTEANASLLSTAVKIVLFDMLSLDGASLLSRPLVERRDLMRQAFTPEAGVLEFAHGMDILGVLAHQEQEWPLCDGIASASKAGQSTNSVDSAAMPMETPNFEQTHIFPAPTTCGVSNAKSYGPHVEYTLNEMLRAAVAYGCEGLMLKSLSSPYEPSTLTRSDSWIKLKKDYIDGMGDSFDLVPIGGWRGSGRKKRWISPWLVATYDRQEGTFGSVCRVMSGFSDAFYKEATLRYLGRLCAGGHVFGEVLGENESDVCAEGQEPEEEEDGDDECDVDNQAIEELAEEEGSHGGREVGGSFLRSSPAFGVETHERCEFWFEPSEVWEVRGADITISPTHLAAVGRAHPERGLSLRFPRFIRVRMDKRIEDATGPEELYAAFMNQTQAR